MTDPHGIGPARRTLVRVAGATAAAYSPLSTVAGAAIADDPPEATDRLVVHPIPAGVPAGTSFSGREAHS
ncbi:hypothetical protein ACTMTI_29245 [Nonomuraea sp. H19]|uniref:hypothetical protein n=1 Tax=Nonomuraea sp. H19 TaxID=3452206 RepID=UPI003F8CD434